MRECPPPLASLQQKISDLRLAQRLELQNGDMGYASAPSNIALLKYWGKEPGEAQIPTNSSVSFTLGGLRSVTKVTVRGRFLAVAAPPLTEAQQLYTHQFFLSDSAGHIIEEGVSAKLGRFLESILHPYAPDVALRIESYNQFPTACGLASSASGYAALVGAIADLLQLSKHLTPQELQLWLSHWARLGSGSATRSTMLATLETPLFVGWIRAHAARETEPSGQYGDTQTRPLTYHPRWASLQHLVLVLNEAPKSVTSSAGHRYAASSPFYAPRLAGLPHVWKTFCQALESYDFQTVLQLTEQDALHMHAIMQTTQHPAVYLNTEVGAVLGQFIAYRDQHELRAFWTLDAGPNIHILFDEAHKEPLFAWLNQLTLPDGSQPAVLYSQSSNPYLLLGPQGDA